MAGDLIYKSFFGIFFLEGREMFYSVVLMDDSIEIACFLYLEDANDWLFSGDADIFWDMCKNSISVRPALRMD